MFLEQLDSDIQALQEEINLLMEEEDAEQNKANDLQEQLDAIYKEINNIRMRRRNKETQIQSLLCAQLVLKDYDLSTLEPSPEKPEEDEPEAPEDEERYYPVPETGAEGNLLGKKTPIGVFNGKNIYEWFIPTYSDYWTKGEQVKFTDGNVYESIIEGANTWSPYSFSQGWKGLGNFEDINERG